MKHIKIKKDKIEQAIAHILVLFPHTTFDQLSSVPRRAFGVDHVDKCPVTDKKRIHLLDEDGFETFAWVFEEFTEGV